MISENGHKFLGTWITVSLRDKTWHILASSKSAKPPCYFVIDALSGELIFKSENADRASEDLMLLPIVESYRVEIKDGKPIWTKN